MSKGQKVETVRLNANVPADLYREVKRLLIDDDGKITYLVIDLLRRWVAEQRREIET